MGHYLIILAQDSREKIHHKTQYDEEDSEEISAQSTLLAVDLRDYRIQKAKIPQDMFCLIEEFTFTKYKDNQIIKFGGKKDGASIGALIQITVKSFERMTQEFFF